MLKHIIKLDRLSTSGRKGQVFRIIVLIFAVFLDLKDLLTGAYHLHHFHVTIIFLDISFTVLLYLKKNLGINWKRAGQYLGVSRERLRRIEEIGIASARPGQFLGDILAVNDVKLT